MASKQAVLIIHGIGEQRPMGTLRGFVETVWTSDSEVHHKYAKPGVFSKPDEISGSFELRRLTTTSDRKGVLTDFYEFYWAHLMEGTILSHVVMWLRSLLLRWPWNVPAALRGAWFLVIALLLAIAFLAVQTVLPEEYRMGWMPKWLTGGLGFFLTICIIPLVNGFVGDAARYLMPAPPNIQRRQAIRAKGVEVLKKLHESGEYERIIVVGHSLGSVIGYDILTYAWPEYARQADLTKPNPALDEIEKTIQQPDFDFDKFRVEQRALAKELRTNGCGWLVTDFVTAGCPLTHAELLLAYDADNLKSKQEERELPTCPPVLESGLISFPHDRVHRRLHHAAMFGATRWTNIYFSASWLVFGDIIGGPLRRLFGMGIRDCPVRTTQRGGLLSHTLYWDMGGKMPVEEHIRVLRTAVNLLDE
jgi:hypothetical protein